jgi:hypothetical protein
MKRLVTETESKAKPQRNGTACSAIGCPLPATFHGGEAGDCCALHVGAKRAGWPKATEVAIEMAKLWEIAREAECAAPMADDEIRSRSLFKIAGSFGLVFTDPQREVYRTSRIKLRAAGLIVQTAIAQAARDAADTVHDRAPVQSDPVDSLAALLAARAAA